MIKSVGIVYNVPRKHIFPVLFWPLCPTDS